MKVYHILATTLHRLSLSKASMVCVCVYVCVRAEDEMLRLSQAGASIPSLTPPPTTLTQHPLTPCYIAPLTKERRLASLGVPDPISSILLYVCTVGEKSAIAEAVGDVRTVVESSNKKKQHHAIRQSIVVLVILETPPTLSAI